MHIRITKSVLIAATILSWSCSRNSNSEIHQKSRDNILDVRDRVTKIEMEDVPVTDFATPYILKDYLIVSDYKSPDKLIHLLDKNTFKYITSIGNRGQGPHEISNLGEIAINETDRIFHVIDHGKQKIYSFKLDSVLINPTYFPTEILDMNPKTYPRNFIHINDTLSIGTFLKTTENGDYMPIISRWNRSTGEIHPMKYLKHPEIERKRTCFTASVKNELYVEGYWYHDLLTIGYLNGDFKCNIYGPKWDNSPSNTNGYFENILFCKDKIIASYLGGKRTYSDQNGGQHAIYPTKFLIFDKDGHYIQTLETGHPSTIFCYDPENNRIIMTLADDMLFGYLDLAGII